MSESYEKALAERKLLLARADASCDQFIHTLSLRDQRLFRRSHRIAFKAGYIMAIEQLRWLRKTK